MVNTGILEGKGGAELAMGVIVQAGQAESQDV